MRWSEPERVEGHLTIIECIARVHLSDKTLIGYIKQGKLRAVKRNRMWWVPEEEIARLEAERRERVLAARTRDAETPEEEREKAAERRRTAQYMQRLERLYRKGESHAQMAAHLGVSARMVREDIVIMRQRWLAEHEQKTKSERREP